MSDPFGVNRNLSMVVCNNPDDAIDKGFDYKTWDPRPVPLNIDKAVIVRKGMTSGRSTVDLLLTDENGHQYVALISAKLLKMVADMAVDEP